MKICDLHGLRFEDGKEKLIAELNDCILKGETAIQIIHGYHGHSFKDYIQSGDFIRDMEEEGIYLSLNGIHSKGGMSEFHIDIPTKTEIPPILDNNNSVNFPIQKKKMTLDEAKVFFERKNNSLS